MHHLRLGLAAAIATLLLPCGTGARTQAQESTVSVVVSPAQEVAWGRKALEEFLAVHPVSADGNLLVRADEVGRKVARVSDRPHLSCRVIVIEGDEPQAYAFPGGTICLTEGAARLYTVDDELAFALGHELAHITLRHHINKLRVIRALESEEAGASELLRAVESAFDRDAENEADRFGALYAVRAGYSFTASVEALARLGAATRGPEEDASHDAFKDRVTKLAAFRDELEKALDAFDRGLEALNEGKPDDAITLFNLFVGEFPNSVAGHVNLGAAYLARVRMTAGTPQGLSEELPILPDPGIVVRGGVNILDLNEALANFERALSLQPDDVIARAGMGLAYARLRQFDEARSALETALEFEADRAELVLCRGNVEFMAGAYADAVPYYLRALELRPDWPQARRNLALTYESANHLDAAREAWTPLLEQEEFAGEARRHLTDLGLEVD